MQEFSGRYVEPSGVNPMARKACYGTKRLRTGRSGEVQAAVRLAGIIDVLRSAPFMDRDRALVGTGIFGVFCAVGLLGVLVTSDGMKDWMGRPLGTDFIALYAGGKVVFAAGALVPRPTLAFGADVWTALGVGALQTAEVHARRS